MQLFTHLLSSYLQGMGDFFSALLGKAGMGPVVLPFPIATIPHEKRTYPD